MSVVGVRSVDNYPFILPLSTDHAEKRIVLLANNRPLNRPQDLPPPLSMDLSNRRGASISESVTR